MPTPRDDVWAALERLAPLHLAEEWDNVGRLVEIPDAPQTIERVRLTIDLTAIVLDAAIADNCDLIVAYHPPIFARLTRLTTSDAKQRILLRSIRAGIAIYSPHTALDAAPGGVNDWLSEACGPGASRGIPPRDDGHPGLGRHITLDRPLSLDEAIARIKTHLDLQHVRVAARQAGKPVRSLAVCAGAGGGVLAGQSADLWLTGEMRHHDVLAALDHGTNVVLCEHTNTERGYLPRLRQRLTEECPGLQVTIAADDADPLRVT